MKRKHITAVLLSALMVASSAVSVFAAHYDFTRISDKKVFPLIDVAATPEYLADIAADVPDYTIELKDGNNYPLEDYMKVMKDNPTFTEDQAIAELNKNVLMISSVNPLSDAAVKINFSKAIDKLDKADVSVTDVETLVKHAIKDVKLGESKMFAEVSLHDKLVAGKSYKVEVKDVGEKTFAFTVADVDKIEVDAIQPVKVGVATPIKYKVLDKNGLDITGVVQADITFDSSVPVADGKVTLAGGQTALVTVVYKEGTEQEVRSPKINLKAELPKVAKLLNVSVAPAVLAVADFEKEGFEPVLNVNIDTKPFITAYYEDQFGDKGVESKGFASLDRSTALIDQASGKITPLKEGAFDVRFTSGAVNEVKSLKVVGKVKLDKLVLKESEVSVSNQAEKKVTVEFKDQFGNPFDANTKTITATVKSGAELLTVNPASNAFGATATEFEFNLKPKAGKEGTARVEFAIDNVKTVLIVKVVKPGATDGFKVEGKKKLNKSAAPGEEPPSTMKLTVTPVDAGGNPTGPALAGGATYIVRDSEGNESASVAITAAINAAGMQPGKYTAVVKVGSIPANNEWEFEVVDSKQKVVELKNPSNNQITVNGNLGDIKDEIKALLRVKVGDTVVTDAAFTALHDLDITSLDSSIIAGGVNVAAVDTLKNGSVDLLITRVEVSTAAPTNLANEEIDTNITIRVIVDDTTAPDATIPAGTGADNQAANLHLTFDEVLYKDGVKVANNADLADQFAADGTVTITSAIYTEATKKISFVLAGSADADKLNYIGSLTDHAGNPFVKKGYVYAALGTLWSEQP